MVVDLIHLGRFDANGTVVGRKCLVKPSHHAADAGGIVDQIYFSPVLGGIHGAIDSGDPAADNQY